MKQLLTLLLIQIVFSPILNADFLKTEWTRQISSSDKEIVSNMIFDKNNSFYLYTDKDKSPYLSKYTSDGYEVWSGKQSNRSRDIVLQDEFIYSSGDKPNIDISANAQYYGTPYNDAYISKTTIDGKELWSTSFGSIGADGFNSMSIDSKGNIYATGFTYGLTWKLPYDPATVVDEGFIQIPTKILLVKLTSNGSKDWVLEYENGEGFTISRSSGIDLTLDENNNLYVIGNGTWNLPKNTHDTNSGVFISKYLPDGTHLWTRQYGYSRALKILIRDNLLYAIGKSFVMKLNFDGDIIWSLDHKKLYFSDLENMSIDSNGNIFVSGSTYYSAAGHINKGSNDVFISKISPSGEVLHNTLLGAIESDYTISLGIDSKDSIYLLWKSQSKVDRNYNWHTFISKFKEDKTEPLNLSNASLTYKKRNNSLISWQLISLPFPAYIRASELNVKQIYGFDFYNQEYFTPIELEPGKGYWVLPKSAETLNFSKQTFYEKRELFDYMKKQYKDTAKFNRWNLLGTPFDTTVEELKKEIGFKAILTFNPKKFEFITDTETVIKAGTGFWTK